MQILSMGFGKILSYAMMPHTGAGIGSQQDRPYIKMIKYGIKGIYHRWPIPRIDLHLA